MREFCVLCIVSVERDDAFTVIEFTDLIVNPFNVISFVSDESAFCYQEKGMCISEDFQGNRRIMDICGDGDFADRQA